MWGGQRYDEELYSTCASPVVPHPSTGHAHGCLASEIGRDPAFPTRFDRTVASLEVSLLAPSRLGRDWNGQEDYREREVLRKRVEAMRWCALITDPTTKA